jgi:hypothetical protein
MEPFSDNAHADFIHASYVSIPIRDTFFESHHPPAVGSLLSALQ